MLRKRSYNIKLLIRKVLTVVAGVAAFYSCASIGRPDGGPRDETPPRFMKSSPVAGALNSTRKKISLEFDEYIKFRINHNFYLIFQKIYEFSFMIFNILK